MVYVMQTTLDCQCKAAPFGHSLVTMKKTTIRTHGAKVGNEFNERTTVLGFQIFRFLSILGASFAELDMLGFSKDTSHLPGHN